MHQIIQLCDAITATVETRATGAIRLSLDHPVIDLQRADMTASQALALSRALLLAHDLLTGAERPLQAGPSGAKRNAGEGAQGGHPQRIYQVEFDERLASQAGRINWLALLTLAAITGFWVAFGLALDSAPQAGAM